MSANWGDTEDGVYITIYNAAGTLIYEHWSSTGDWYDEEHPLIDDEPSTRVRYGARVAEGTQYRNGVVCAKWKVLYTEAGEFYKDYMWDEQEGWVERPPFVL